MTLYIEQRELAQTVATQLDSQLDNAEQRLSMAAAELQAAGAFIQQANPPIKQIGAFIGNLPLSSDRRVPWALVKPVDAAGVADLERQVRLETGNANYAVKLTAGRGRLLPIVASFGAEPVAPDGEDLGEAPEFASALKNAEAVADHGARMFPVPPNMLSAKRLFLALYIPARVQDGAGPPSAAVIIRGTRIESLAAAADLGPGQQIRVLDLSGGHQRVLLGPAASGENQVSWSSTVAANIPALTLGVAISRPATSGLPRLWLVPLVVGILATLTYVAFRAGLLIRLQANAAMAQLAGTERSLFAARERETLFFEHSGTANCEVNYPGTTILRVNDAFCRLFDYRKEELLGMSLAELTHPDDRAISADALITDDGTPKPEVQIEKRYLRKDGAVIWAVANATLNTDPVTGAHSYLAVIVDITARKSDEETKSLLLKELAHRVRNTVQLTASLARQTARSARTVKEYDSKFHLRLAALTAAHDLLFEQGWRSASLARIVDRSLKPLLPEDASVCPVSIDVPDVELTTQQAQTLAIAIQELAGNSAQFGALMHGGDIALNGTAETDSETGRRSLKITWRENSRRRFRKPQKVGFGTVMLEIVLPEQFGGTAVLDWRSNGLQYAAILPLG